MGATPLPQMTQKMKNILQNLSFATLGSFFSIKMPELLRFEVVVKFVTNGGLTN